MSKTSEGMTGRLQRWLAPVTQWTFTGEMPPRAASSANADDENTVQRSDEATTTDASTTDAATTNAAEQPERPASSDDLELTEVETSFDVLVNLGLTEPEFALELLEAHDGKLPQKAFVDQLDWSKSKVSRMLTELEEDGEIVRISLGQEKIVYAPEQAPGQEPFSHRESNRESPDSSSTPTNGPGSDRVVDSPQ